MSSSCQPIKSGTRQAVQQKVNPEPGSLAKASLYVIDLDTSVTEGDLYDLFSKHGQVLSAKISRDHITGVSRGYGYVNFSSLRDATLAMKLLNFKPLNGKHIRVMLSNRDSNLKSDGTTIFFKDFAESLGIVTINVLFSYFGTIVVSELAIDSNGLSKGFGYVKFNHEEAAKKAIGCLDYMVVENSLVSVVPFISKEDRDREKYKFQNYPTLYVGNMRKMISDEAVVSAFSEYGPVARIRLMRDEEGYGTGSGFVIFEDFDDAVCAIKGLNGKRASTIKGLDPIRNSDGDQVWYVGWANSMFKRKDHPQSRRGEERDDILKKLEGANLYIKNFGDDMTEKKLKQMFSDFGMITSCKVILDSQGISRGYGFVGFASPEDATKAVNAMNGKFIGRKPLHVSVARRREEKKANLQMNAMNGKIIGQKPLDVSLARRTKLNNANLQMNAIGQKPLDVSLAQRRELMNADPQMLSEQSHNGTTYTPVTTEVAKKRLLAAEQYMRKIGKVYKPLKVDDRHQMLTKQSYSGTTHTRLYEARKKLPEVSEKAGQYMGQPRCFQNIQWEKVGEGSPHARLLSRACKKLFEGSEYAGQHMRRPRGSQNIQWEKVGEQSHSGTARKNLVEVSEKAGQNMRQPLGSQNIQWEKVGEQSHSGTSGACKKLLEVSEKAGQNMRHPLRSQNIQWEKVGEGLEIHKWGKVGEAEENPGIRIDSGRKWVMV